MYDPSYLNLDKNDPDAWKIYAEKVRDLMAKVLDVPKVEFGMRDWKDFQKFYKIELKKLKKLEGKNIKK